MLEGRVASALIVILIATATLTAPVLLAYLRERPPTGRGFEIVSPDEWLFISQDELEYYDWANPTMKCRTGFDFRFPSNVKKNFESPGLPYIVRVDGRECYRGDILSNASSSGAEMTEIRYRGVGAQRVWKVGREYDWETLPDFRENELVREALWKAGKLR